MTNPNPRQPPPRRPVFESDQVAVFDDFLDPLVFSKVLAYCASDRYQEVHMRGWRKAWRVNDGFPLQGSTILTGPAELLRGNPAGTSYPVDADIDIFIEQLLSVLPKVQDVIGSQSRDWSTFTSSPWIYPAGASLSVHQDGYRYSGAFTFFAHRYWNIHWGGYLLVLDAKTPKVRPGSAGSDHAFESGVAWLDDTAENERLWEPGLAQCIFPKPNRLVFISSQAEHLVSRVDVNAGHHSRVTISGFFHRPQPEETRSNI